MKIKTSKLIGTCLDWQVAVALGRAVYMRRDFITKRHAHLKSEADLAWHLLVQTNDPIIGDLADGSTQVLPNYSTDWSHGGPVLNKARISRTIDQSGLWLAYDYFNYADAKEHMQCDRSELVAGLRCFVARELGDEVDVPKELLQWGS